VNNFSCSCSLEALSRSAESIGGDECEAPPPHFPSESCLLFSVHCERREKGDDACSASSHLDVQIRKSPHADRQSSLDRVPSDRSRPEFFCSAFNKSPQEMERSEMSVRHPEEDPSVEDDEKRHILGATESSETVCPFFKI
jgi:hypothetical protein